jgi:hypothetical protein
MDLLGPRDASNTAAARGFWLLDSSAQRSTPTATRKPLLLFELDGLLLLRLAHRSLPGLLLNDPPRNTRAPGHHVPAAFARQQSGGLKICTSKNGSVKKIKVKNISPNLFDPNLFDRKFRRALRAHNNGTTTTRKKFRNSAVQYLRRPAAQHLSTVSIPRLNAPHRPRPESRRCNASRTGGC